MVSFRTHLADPREATVTRCASVVRIASLAGCLLLLMLWPIRSHATDSNALLNAWFAAQTNLHTWRADFVQTRTLKSLTQPLKASGRIWFTTPDLFRWEVGDPAQTIAMRQTNQLLIVYPRLKRLERYPLDEKAAGPMRDALALIDAGFPRDRSQLESYFKILSVVETDGGFTVALQPRSAMARRFMGEIVIGFRTNNFSLISTEVTFIDGSHMRNDFTNITMNPPIDADVYQYAPGPDFKMVEPLGR